MENWVNIVVSILSGLAVCIPLVYKLVVYVQTSVKEKNWANIMTMAIGYMKTAEEKFTDGATRKEWVLAMIKQSAVSANYTLDDEAIAKISALIDAMCDMAKTVNSPDKAAA
jgi:hypothetical protein